MAVIKAFKALRPIPEKAADVASLPYDVFTEEEARMAVVNKPESFLRVVRPETTMAENTDLTAPAVYRRAKENLDALIEQGILVKEEKPCLYLYELTMDNRSQTGLVACASVDEYDNGKIKKHELTREAKEKDRINHVDACNAHTGPVFLTYRAQEEIDALSEEIKKQLPFYDFTADDGIRHRVWRIDDALTIHNLTKAFEAVDTLYIADGHHRAASASKVAEQRRKKASENTGDEDYQVFLSVIFPDEQLKVLDYNRVVKDLNGLSDDAFFEAVAENFDIEPVSETMEKPAEKTSFGMYLNDRWYLLKAKAGTYDPDDPVNVLDVSILQNNLLAPILGIGDPRTDERIDFVGGIRGLKELERRVHTDMQVAFALYPTSVAELMAIADAGLLMPPKSTWFEPKLRSGLFVHEL